MQLTCTCKSWKFMCFPLFWNWTSKTSEDFQVQLTCWNVAQTEREREKKKTQSLYLKTAKHDGVCVWCAATVTSSLGKTKVSVTHSILKWHRLTSSTRCWTYNGCSDVPNGSRNKMSMGGWVVLVKKKRKWGRNSRKFSDWKPAASLEHVRIVMRFVWPVSAK